VATFVEAARGTGADLLTCFLVLSVGREPNEEIPIGHYALPGAVVLLGTFGNHFGSRCVPIRKNAFSRLEVRCEGARQVVRTGLSGAAFIEMSAGSGAEDAGMVSRPG
jgi:hypothetical protein